MKRLLSVFIIFLYLFTSSTLVHSFCAEAHMNEVESDHSCCDEEETGSKDCFDKCMSSFDSVNPVYDITVTSGNDIDSLLQTSFFEDALQENIQNHFLTEYIFDPPWQWNYVGIIKKLE